ncbi:hypothetical protein SEA_LILBEANIE_69 [Gordonia phage Lilbeanie]|uniref:Uncharacterized protein n=1 Tax=Gordonia phage Lilbeanie TaxID=2794947 RepID=A0A7T1NXR5_9CAUD|nr:hypothetical protein J1773_gp69 [Gordonia phage Lilbeanie]QPO17147.1 hypothetical protein SEA_LILBEANIE_69 [Gordonia phage Lilbeanie]
MSMCGASHPLIDRGAPCVLPSGAHAMHQTANGLTFLDEGQEPEDVVREAGGYCYPPGVEPGPPPLTMDHPEIDDLKIEAKTWLAGDEDPEEYTDPSNLGLKPELGPPIPYATEGYCREETTGVRMLDNRFGGPPIRFTLRVICERPRGHEGDHRSTFPDGTRYTWPATITTEEEH